MDGHVFRIRVWLSTCNETRSAAGINGESVPSDKLKTYMEALCRYHPSKFGKGSLWIAAELSSVMWSRTVSC